MEEVEIEAFVDKWIKFWEDDAQGVAWRDSSTREEQESPTSITLDWKFDGKHELLWRFILSANKRDLNKSQMAVLAAGELENLIAEFGELYIDQIEELSRTDAKFRHLLGGVWRNSSKPEVWARIEKARGETW